MKKMNIHDMSLVPNVCNQLLCEVEKNEIFSLAHVFMNPKAESILHEHQVTDEIYVITRGSGRLVVGSSAFQVQAGDAVSVPAGFRHKMVNTGVGYLEHFVIATPPFNPNDVHLNQSWRNSIVGSQSFDQPDTQECFDGAKIVPYTFQGDISVAFGWITDDSNNNKTAHYHKKATEWIYVIDGDGFLEHEDKKDLIGTGDWISINPGERHALLNCGDHDLIVVCICNPCFSMDDVYF